MNFSIDFVHGLVFGIAHADTLYVEVDDDEVLEYTGIVLLLGFFQITMFW